MANPGEISALLAQVASATAQSPTTRAAAQAAMSSAQGMLQAEYVKKKQEEEEKKKKAEKFGGIGEILGTVGGTFVGGPVGGAIGGALGRGAGYDAGGADGSLLYNMGAQLPGLGMDMMGNKLGQMASNKLAPQTMQSQTTMAGGEETTLAPLSTAEDVRNSPNSSFMDKGRANLSELLGQPGRAQSIMNTATGMSQTIGQPTFEMAKPSIFLDPGLRAQVDQQFMEQNIASQSMANDQQRLGMDRERLGLEQGRFGLEQRRQTGDERALESNIESSNVQNEQTRQTMEHDRQLLPYQINELMSGAQARDANTAATVVETRNLRTPEELSALDTESRIKVGEAESTQAIKRYEAQFDKEMSIKTKSTDFISTLYDKLAEVSRNEFAPSSLIPSILASAEKLAANTDDPQRTLEAIKALKADYSSMSDESENAKAAARTVDGGPAGLVKIYQVPGSNAMSQGQF